jgi:lipoprotein-anchoring transpeptidase ErfK/SrfK
VISSNRWSLLFRALFAVLAASVLSIFGVATANAAPAAQAPTVPAVDKAPAVPAVDHAPAAPAVSPAPAAPAPTPSAAGLPCSAAAKACMSLSRRQAWLTDGAGHVTFGPVPARGGMTRAPSPVGTFQVISKDAHFYSTQFHAPMPYSVFFYPGVAFHADNPAVASNGCIHLNASAAQRFFSNLRVGDQVQIVR